MLAEESDQERALNRIRLGFLVQESIPLKTLSSHKLEDFLCVLDKNGIDNEYTIIQLKEFINLDPDKKTGNYTLAGKVIGKLKDLRSLYNTTIAPMGNLKKYLHVEIFNGKKLFVGEYTPDDVLVPVRLSMEF